MSEDNNKGKIALQKKQAKSLKKEIRFLRAKLKDTQESRDQWKKRCKELQNLEIKSRDNSSFFEGSKAKHYSYSVLLVCFCANIEAYGSMSLRACVHVLFCIQMALGSPKKIASYSSIRVWVSKLGKYRIENEQNENTSWVLWLDESIHIGGEKILLVLGMPQKNICFQQAPKLSDVRILYMEARSQWKGEDIGKVLENLEKKFVIAYIISDEGNNLKNAYQQGAYRHISDCTHALSKGIEKAYKGQENFEQFCHWAGSLRQKWTLKKDRKAYIPPSQRSKVRFSNLYPLIKWAKKNLDQWENVPKEIQEDLGYLQEKRSWILDFWQIEEQLSTISRVLKTEGYSLENDRQIRKIMNGNKSREGLIFSQNVDSYLEKLSSQLLGEERIYCCSDIIESAFGKCKLHLSKNQGGLSSFMFGLAAMSGHYLPEEVKKALESNRDKDLRKRARF